MLVERRFIGPSRSLPPGGSCENFTRQSKIDGALAAIVLAVLMYPVGLVLGQTGQPAQQGSKEAQMREAPAAPAGVGLATTQPSDRAAIELFDKIETIARIPASARGPQIARLYRDLTPPLM